MSSSKLPDQDLWQAVVATSDRALGSGHLRTLSTRSVTINDGNVTFLVRVATQSMKRESWKKASNSVDRNPFLPHEPELYVAKIAANHIGLLNKYNVVDHHLLIVTREFQRQETCLTVDDFAALAQGLYAYPSLGFYNSCRTAGASQPHRHLQLVPLPLMEGNHTSVPIEDVLMLSSTQMGSVLRADALPFAHGWLQLDRNADSNQFARQLIKGYEQLIDSQGWTHIDERTPYNLVVTRDWMLLVPREHEFCCEGVSLNALAYAGSLFAKNNQQLDKLTDLGPMRALVRCARAA